MDTAKSKSVTIRLENDAELSEWVNAQNSPTASIKAAVKMSMYQYGIDKDLLDAFMFTHYATPEMKNAISQHHAQTKEYEKSDIDYKTNSEPTHDVEPEADISIQPQPQESKSMNQNPSNANMSSAMASLL